jgi:uncharacterized protein YcgI (DUF1989 family)
MGTTTEIELAANSGWATAVKAGEIVRITAMTRVAVVCFNANDLTERFDQARTKVYNMRIWISPGEQLYSKLNNPMMTMIADGFAPEGRHDLQYGMCSRETGLGGTTDAGHGCHENLAEALKPWRIAAHEIPMPLNLFAHSEIDTASGAIKPSPVRPSKPVVVDLRAEMDLVLALSACPDKEVPASGAPVRVAIVGD